MKQVYVAIAAVAGDLARDGISKARENKAQKFSFRGIDDVYNALAPLLAKYKLCVLPRVLTRECVERKTAAGGTLYFVTVEEEFDLVSAEDGSTHTIRTVGEAFDSGDKATNKAMSAAYKYAMFQAFCIPTEGDNDADATTPPPTVPAAPPPKREQTPAGDDHDASWAGHQKQFFAQLAEVWPQSYDELCDYVYWMYRHRGKGSGERPSRLTTQGRNALLKFLRTDASTKLHGEWMAQVEDAFPGGDGEGNRG